MPVMIDTVSRFSPGNCEPELLESMLVGRHDLATRLEKSVVDGIETGAGHHWLLVGPRGVGKTHLLAILFNRVNACEAIRRRVAIAYMKEEERGVASYLDWLVRILRAFDRRSEAPPAERLDLDLGERLEALKGLPLERAAVAAERLLLEFVGERRVLLIAENLGELFSESKGMGRSGQQKLRDLLQQHPVWTVIASAQALFEDVQSKEAPFYGFFKVRHLGTLSFEEAVELLSKLAASEGRHELARFFHSDAGQGRIRAIHEITGGNPRLLIIFYQFVDRESIEDLSRPFLKMVDNLTSYYQEQIQPLPALQQKILELLCEHRSPATVKEIARSCFISHQTASAQLRRIAERRYVQSTTVGRESYYELREPLFRICFEVKENLGYPIRLFVDFLGRFYSMEEQRRHQKAYCMTHFKVVLALLQAGELDRGMEQLRTIVKAGSGQSCEGPLPLCVAEINTYLLLNTLLDRLATLVRTQKNIFGAGTFRQLFIQGLIGALTEVLRRHRDVPRERLIGLRDSVVSELGEDEDLSVVCRLFTTGVGYLETGDRRVLLTLPIEERSSLEKLLQPDY